MTGRKVLLGRGFTLVEPPVVSRRKRNAFTLVELLVVIAIIGILVALLLPAIQAARESARRVQCLNNCRQLGLAFHGYHDGKKKFPPSRFADRRLTWAGLILPFIEEVNLADLVDENKNYDDAQHQKLRETVVPTYICPSRGHDKLFTYTNSPSEEIPNVYLADNVQAYGGGAPSGPRGDYACVSSTFRSGGTSSLDGYFDGAIILPDRPLPSGGVQKQIVTIAKIIDGTSKTLMVAENSYWFSARVSIYDGDDNPGAILGLALKEYIRTVVPRGINFTQTEGGLIASSPFEGEVRLTTIEETDKKYKNWFGGDHTGVINVTLCDGSSRAIKKDTSIEILHKFVTRAGEEVAAIEEL
jgi:prepilin-type N-terminal cleavage/methylation domain-containing protein